MTHFIQTQEIPARVSPSKHGGVYLACSQWASRTRHTLRLLPGSSCCNPISYWRNKYERDSSCGPDMEYHAVVFFLPLCFVCINKRLSFRYRVFAFCEKLRWGFTKSHFWQWDSLPLPGTNSTSGQSDHFESFHGRPFTVAWHISLSSDFVGSEPWSSRSLFSTQGSVKRTLKVTPTY